jgi:hypothetical protein
MPGRHCGALKAGHSARHRFNSACALRRILGRAAKRVGGKPYAPEQPVAARIGYDQEVGVIDVLVADQDRGSGARQHRPRQHKARCKQNNSPEHKSFSKFKSVMAPARPTMAGAARTIYRLGLMIAAVIASGLTSANAATAEKSGLLFMGDFSPASINARIEFRGPSASPIQLCLFLGRAGGL